MRKTDNINTFVCGLSGNLVGSTSWSIRACMELRLPLQLSCDGFRIYRIPRRVHFLHFPKLCMTSNLPLPERRTTGYSLRTHTTAKVLFPYKKCSESNYTPSQPNFILLQLHFRIVITTTRYLNDDLFLPRENLPLD